QYHHGNLREALIQAALVLIAERGISGFAVAELARAVGVSAAAPYRHFRDRDAVLAEVSRRGFEALEADMRAALLSRPTDPVAALEACAQSHLAFAGRDGPVYGAMFDPHFPIAAHPDLARARDAAFGNQDERCLDQGFAKVAVVILLARHEPRTDVLPWLTSDRGGRSPSLNARAEATSDRTEAVRSD
ncbi:MAG: TetR/AcrR family transcriptional regulator, partial [Sphingomonas sp.]